MPTTRIFPIGDRVAVLPNDPVSITPGGLHIPDNAKDKPTRGAVIAVGPGSRNVNGEYMPLSVGVGDQVAFPKYTGQHIEIGDKTIIILREDELLLKMVDEPDAAVEKE